MTWLRPHHLSRRQLKEWLALTREFDLAADRRDFEAMRIYLDRMKLMHEDLVRTKRVEGFVRRADLT